MTDRNLFEQQEHNKRRSTWLTAGFVLFTAWVGFGGDLGFYLLTRDAGPGEYRHVVPVIGLIASLIAGGVALFSWKRGAQQVLSASKAREVVDPATPEERQLVNIVEEMAIASGVPKPRIWIVPDDDPNAFATGPDPERAHVAVTAGLLRMLNRDELQGVVAHEMAHVRNYDIRLMTLLAGMIGAIVLLSDMMRNFLRFGGGRRSNSRGGKKDANPLALLVLGLWLISLILAPIVTRLLAMSISRKREFLADATGAQFTRNPAALASALAKLDGSGAPTRFIARGAAHMCIVDPAERRFAGKSGFLGMMASHPPIEERVARLRAMSFLGPDGSRAVESLPG
ncbi:MAG: M48 family metallopeptidase [Gemmatimonadales bacterium]|nr:M48 family metallopeptidase [Gemmatimonadales bacterium]